MLPVANATFFFFQRIIFTNGRIADAFLDVSAYTHTLPFRELGGRAEARSMEYHSFGPICGFRCVIERVVAMKRATFYKCPKCGNIVVKAYDGGGKLMCCGEEMQVIDPNTTDAATEKHVPVVQLADGKLTVKVGEVTHPMDEDHFIQWVYVITEEGLIVRCLKPGQAPEVVIDLDGQTPLSVFEFCNKHGLWKTDL